MVDTRSAWRTAVTAGLAISATNLVVLWLGHRLGADMQVARSTGEVGTQVGVGSVVLMSLAPMILGWLALRLAARRGVRAWRGVAWLGLALGLLTVPMPVSVTATTGTSTTLASMHVVAGLVWFAAVRRSAFVPRSSDAHVAGIPKGSRS